MTQTTNLLLTSALLSLLASGARAQVDVETPTPLDPPSVVPVDASPVGPATPIEPAPSDAELDRVAPALELPGSIPPPVGSATFEPLPPTRLPPIMAPDPVRDARAVRRQGRGGALALVIPGAIGTALGALCILVSYFGTNDETGSPLEPVLITGSVVFSVGIAVLLGGLYWLVNPGEDGEDEPLEVALREPGVLRF